MKVSSILFALAQAALLGSATAAKCNADNCARAATGTARGLASARVAACSSFQQCTVTGAATTVTTTVTVAAAMADRFHVVRIPKRQAATPVTSCGSAVPSFASTCGVTRYASACSCFGITKTYTTVSGSTVTVTDQTTVTAPTGTSVTTTASGTGVTGTAPSGGITPTAGNSTFAVPAVPATLVNYLRL